MDDGSARRFARYRQGAALSALALGLLVPAAPAGAETVALSGTVTAQPAATSTVELPVPAGVRARRVEGVLTVAGTASGPVDLLVEDRVVKRLAAPTSRRIELPVPVQPAGGVLTVGIRNTAAPSCRAPASVTLDHLRLVYDGSERPPRSVGDFFAASVTRVDVVVPTGAPDDVLAAGLSAVGALSRAYPAPVPVALYVSGRAPAPVPGQRVVAVREGPAKVEIDPKSRIPTLVVSGVGDALRVAGAALGSPDLTLAGNGSVTGLGLTPADPVAVTSRTVADLGIAHLDLSGRGEATAYLGVRQDLFGGPVSSFDLHLRGTQTVLTGAQQGRVDAYANGALVGSTALDDSPGVSLDVTVSGAALRAENGIDLVLVTGAGGAGDCAAAALPVTVSFDGSRSTIRATRGASAAGFGAFPQALGGQLPVAIGPAGASRADSARAAAYLVSALQRASSRQLDVDLVDLAEFLDGDRTGLLVGATNAQLGSLSTDLHLERARVVEDAGSHFQVASDSAFAALQPARGAGRDVLALGGWAPSTDPDGIGRLSDVAAGWVAEHGWAALSGAFLIVNSDGEVGQVGAQALVPQRATVDERRPFVWWLVAGVSVLLAVALVSYLLHARRVREARELVRAQLLADGERGPDGAGRDG